MRARSLAGLFVAAATAFAFCLTASGAETTQTAAEEKRAPRDEAPPPPMPPEPPEGSPPPPETGLEPEVKIVPRGSEIHEEYRINGQLYMIKVIPAKGPPYYLIDEEGKGQFRRSDFEPRLKIPRWVLKRW
jgi:hypothetical protein